jgi:serine/threonine protein phosphatase PrpC
MDDPHSNSNSEMDNTMTLSSCPLVISTAEAMNPSRRNTMEDRHVVHAPGTWKAPSPHMSYLAVYDGHGGKYDAERVYISVSICFIGLSHLNLYCALCCLCCTGRDIVDFLEHGLSYHIAQELSSLDDVDVRIRLERAFLMADIHARQAGIVHSGATVACCLVEVSELSVMVYLALLFMLG